MTAPEAVEVRALAELHLLLEGDANVMQLGLDLRVVLREGRKAGERASGGLVLALLDEPTGGLGEVRHAGGKDEGPDELYGYRDLPGRVILSILGCVVDDRSEEKADGDGPLVAGDDGTTDPFGGALGLVHGDEGGDEADAETGEDTADDERGPLVAAGLESDAGGEDGGRDEDTAATADPVSDVGTREST